MAAFVKDNLKNDHNVYILGAGFSKDANMPEISDFLIRMRDGCTWLSGKADRFDEINSIGEVLKFRLAAASAAYWITLDLENIEELFSLAAASPDGAKLNKDIRKAIAATLDFCEATADDCDVPSEGKSVPSKLPSFLKLRPSKKHEHSDEFPRYAHYVAKLLGKCWMGNEVGKNTFITFNYDTVLEDALYSLKTDFSYCLGKQKVNYDSSALCSKNNSDVIQVLKLHGSINWARETTSGRDLKVFGHYEDARKIGGIPELLPPTWKKILENQLANVWDSAVEALKYATRVIIIGFSIPPTDMHFKYLMAAGLQQNVSLRQIYFINPKAEELKVQAEKILREKYISSKKISFYPLQLNAFIKDSEMLAQIGRPIKRLPMIV
jgi:hypothetical protein